MSRFKEFKGVRQDNNIYEQIKNKTEMHIPSTNNAHVKPREKSPPYVGLFKYAIILLAIGFVGYVLLSQFLLSKDFTYSYDLGNDEYLSPQERTLDVQTYRNITESLVYFDVPIPRGAESVIVETRFKENFPDVRGMRLGAKDQAVWSYQYKLLFSSSLDALARYESKGEVYRINKNKPLVSLNELKVLPAVTVATDEGYAPQTVHLNDYAPTKTVITSSLRGEQMFYVYAKGDLSINIKKQDLNWYENDDSLEIGLYDLDDNLIVNTTIADDGITTEDKPSKNIQEGSLKANGLDEGVYKLKLSDADVLIKEISLNSNKIVSERLFLADNNVYSTNTKPSQLFTRISNNGKVRLLTYHVAGLQEVSYNSNGITKHVVLSDKGNPLYVNLSEGEYDLVFPKSDVLVSGQYFAFSKEQYFEPFIQKVVSLDNDARSLDGSVDYVVSSYNTPVKDGDWLIGETEFDVKDLYVKDGKLQFVFHVPHLDQPEYANYTIPVDWINITVHKPGVFGK